MRFLSASVTFVAKKITRTYRIRAAFTASNGFRLGFLEKFVCLSRP